MSQAMYALRTNRSTKFAALMLIVMGSAVTKSIASLKKPFGPAQQSSGYCGKPCSSNAQCGGTCGKCSGTCHY